MPVPVVKFKVPKFPLLPKMLLAKRDDEVPLPEEKVRLFAVREPIPAVFEYRLVLEAVCEI